MTLDVIGIAGGSCPASLCELRNHSIQTGFGYEFNALNPSEKPNPLGQAMTEVLSSGTQPSVIGLVQSFVPILRFIVSYNPFYGRLCESNRLHSPPSGGTRSMPHCVI